VPEVRRRSSVASELAWARRVLGAAGVADPRSTALRAWAAVTGRDPGEGWLEGNRDASPPAAARFRRAVREHAAGAPLAYAVGSAGFRTLDLAVDPRVLIPRPETEGLVEEVLRWSRSRWSGPWGTVADIGTGSGAIALSLATEGRFDRVIATDVSADALAVARANLARLSPQAPVEFRQGADYQPLGADRLDVIVSNPPYISEPEFAELEPGVRDFEPRGALVGGPDGLEPTRTLLATGARHLSDGGLLALEIDCRRSQACLALARQAGWSNARVVPDVFGRARYLLATARDA